MTVDLFSTTTGTQTRRAIECKDFMAVILVGHGTNLYPLNEGINVVSKALLPVGNVPIINTVLNWVLDSGLTDILIIAPSSAYSAISNHLHEEYSASSHPKARINLKRDTDGERDLDDDDGDEIPMEGTARILKSFRGMIKTDFVLLPCDISPPVSMPLERILDKHRQTPDAVLTSVFYEPFESVMDDEEKILVGLDKETEELLLIQPLDGLDEDLQLRMALITLHPTLSLTTRLLDAHIYVFRRTVLDLLATRRSKDLESMREQVIPWLIKGGWQRELGERWDNILNPPRRDPLASALARSTTSKHPSSAVITNSSPSGSTTSDHTPLPSTIPPTPSPAEELLAFKDGLPAPTTHQKRHKKPNRLTWKCQVIIIKPEPTSSTDSKPSGKDKKNTTLEGEYLIRANTIAGYWELNRRLLRSIPGSSISNSNSQTPIPSPRQLGSGMVLEDGMQKVGSTGGDQPISATAQISPDSLIGQSTRVGERASIKKSVIGRHCVIGRGAKITGSVLWDFVTVEENARLENVILCSNVRIGEKAQIKDCELGTGFEAKAGANIKSERLVAGQDV